jgi:hypothetical protein
VLDSQYGFIDDINWPNVDIADSTLLLGSIAATATLLVLTLLAAIVGGKSGRRYHDRIDQLLCVIAAGFTAGYRGATRGLSGEEKLT